MSMYNLIGYIKNYSKTTGRLWNYFYRDEPNSGAVGDANYSIRGSKSSDYKTSITGRLEDNNTEIVIVVSLKHLSNFWRALDIPLINYKTNLMLTWPENCVVTSKATRDADPDADPAVAEVNNPTNVLFKIKDKDDDNKLLEQLKKDFKNLLNGINLGQKLPNRLKLTI